MTSTTRSIGPAVDIEVPDRPRPPAGGGPATGTETSSAVAGRPGRSPGHRAPFVFAVLVLVLGTGAFALSISSAIYPLWLGAYLWAAGSLVVAATRRLPVRLPVSLACFVALATLSQAWSVVPELTFRRTTALVGTVLVGLALASWLEPRQIIRALRWAAVAVAVLSLAAPVVGYPYAIDPVHETLRGILATKNSLGRLMTFGIIAAIVEARLGGLRTWRLALFLTPMAVALALTNSAAGAVGTLMGVMVQLWVRITRSATLKAMLSSTLVILAMAVTILLSAGALTASSLAGLAGRDVTLTGRTGIWSYALDAVLTRPLLGHGFGAFWESARGQTISLNFEFVVVNAHSGPLDLLLALGVVGTSLAALTLLSASVDARRQRHDDRESAVARLTILSLVLATTIVESGFLEENSFLTVLLVAAVCAPRRPAGWSGSRSRTERKPAP